MRFSISAVLMAAIGLATMALTVACRPNATGPAKPTGDETAPEDGDDSGGRAAAGTAHGTSSPVGDAEIAQWIEDLAATDRKKRVTAAWQLAERPTAAARATAQLADLLGDGEPVLLADSGKVTTAAREAARALASVGPAAIPDLLAALAAPDQASRFRAARVLGQIGPPAIEPLVEQLDTDNPAYLDGLTKALECLGPSALDAVLAQLKASPDAGMRRGVMVALAQFGDQPGIDALIQGLQDDDAAVRAAAAGSLAEHQSRRAVAPLVDLLVTGAEPSDRVAAAASLGRHGDRRAVEPLITALNDGDQHVREQAALALGNLRATDAVDALAEKVKEADPAVRESAYIALGSLQSSPAVETLLAAMAGEQDSHLRSIVITSLHRQFDPRGVEVFVAALATDQDLEVRRSAAKALITLHDATAIPALIDAILTTDDRGLKGRATKALERIGDESIAPLIAVLQERESSGLTDTQIRTVTRALSAVTSVFANGDDPEKWIAWWQENQR